MKEKLRKQKPNIEIQALVYTSAQVKSAFVYGTEFWLPEIIQLSFNITEKQQRFESAQRR